MGHLIGYARVSTQDQDYTLQIEQLEKYGCQKIFSEKKSGKDTGRPELQKCLEFLREGDKLVVYKIDRLARSTRDLHNIVHELQERKIGVVFIKEQIDFSTPAGKLMFTMLGAMAEFERDLIAERTREGRERAKAAGKHMGRYGKDTREVKRALKLFANREKNGLSVNDIVKQTGVPRSTIYAKAKEHMGKYLYKVVNDTLLINSLRFKDSLVMIATEGTDSIYEKQLSSLITNIYNFLKEGNKVYILENKSMDSDDLFDDISTEIDLERTKKLITAELSLEEEQESFVENGVNRKNIVTFLKYYIDLELGLEKVKDIDKILSELKELGKQ